MSSETHWLSLHHFSRWAQPAPPTSDGLIPMTPFRTYEMLICWKNAPWMHHDFCFLRDQVCPISKLSRGFKETKQEFSWENRPEPQPLNRCPDLISGEQNTITLWSQIQHEIRDLQRFFRAWEKLVVIAQFVKYRCYLEFWASDLVGQVIWFIKNRCQGIRRTVLTQSPDRGTLRMPATPVVFLLIPEDPWCWNIYLHWPLK